MTTQTELRNLVWQACTAIRNEHRDVKKYVEYTAMLLFFKFYDDLQETLPSDLKGLIPKPYRWSTLRNLDPRGFQGANPEVLVRLRTFFSDRKWIGDANYGAIFENFQFDIKHDEVLSRALATLDRINFAGITYDQKGDIYEYLIAKMADAGVKGEFFTPRPIVDLIISVLAPSSGMRVWDPACGTGGFLTRAFDAMALDVAAKTKRGTAEHLQEVRRLREESVFGSETESVSARLARMNMILHGDGHSTILEFNSLDRQSYTHDKLEIRGKKEFNPIPGVLKIGGFDLIMGNPPYGGSQAVSDVGGKFKPWHRSAKPEANFLQVMMHGLAPGGRCGVVLPEGVLFRRDELKIRERLIKDFELEAVIGLFKGAFEFADVKACILIIRRPAASEKWKGTKAVWISEARSFDEIRETAQRFRNRVEDEAARSVGTAEIRRKKLDLKPSKYLRIVPSEATRAEPLTELFDPIPVTAVATEASTNDLYLHRTGPGWKVETIKSSRQVGSSGLILRPRDGRLNPQLLRYFLSAGPLAEVVAGVGSVKELINVLNTELPIPDRERQKQLLARLDVQAAIPRDIITYITNRYFREWVDDVVFAVRQEQLLATSFGPLVDDASDYVDPTDEPDTEWKVFGVTNESGVRQSNTKVGRDFKEGRRYKRLVKGAIVYNPQRVNVGSVGLVSESDDVSIVSPYYPQFTCRDKLNPAFALALIRSPYFSRLVEETAVGAVRSELFFSLFTQIEVPVPNPDRQMEILSEIQRQIASLAPIADIEARSHSIVSGIIAGLFENMLPADVLQLPAATAA